MRLLLVRHGISVSNEKLIEPSIYKGYDLGLSSRGKSQSEELSLKLKNYVFDGIIVSPLRSALETIHPFIDSSDDLKFTTSDLLVRRNLGTLSGITKKNLSLYHEENNTPNLVSWVPPKGESLESVYRRSKLFLSWLEDNYGSDDTLLICSHNDFLKCLRIAILKQKISDYYDFDSFEHGTIESICFLPETH